MLEEQIMSVIATASAEDLQLRFPWMRNMSPSALDECAGHLRELARAGDVDDFVRATLDYCDANSVPSEYADDDPRVVEILHPKGA